MVCFVGGLTAKWMECEGASPGGQTHEQPLEKDPSSPSRKKASIIPVKLLSTFSSSQFTFVLWMRHISDGFPHKNHKYLHYAMERKKHEENLRSGNCKTSPSLKVLNFVRKKNQLDFKLKSN